MPREEKVPAFWPGPFLCLVRSEDAAPPSLRGDFTRLRIFVPQHIVEMGMQALTEVEWQFENTIIGHENDDVACGVDDGGADFAVREMAFDICTNLSVEGVVNVFGDAVPDVAAA